MNQIKIEEEGREVLNKMKDPRMQNLNADAKYERTQKQYNILEKMRCGTHVREIIEHDGIEVPLRLISLKEDQEARLAAVEYVNSIDAHKRIPTLYDAALMVEILYRALSSCPEKVDDADCFMNKHTLYGLPIDSINAFYAKWVALNRKYNPKAETMSDEAVKDLLEAVMDKKKQLSDCTPFQLQKMCGVFLETYTSLKGK